MTKEINNNSTSICLETSFFDRNIDLLGDFLGIHGVDPRSAVDLESIVEATQPWARGDHARPALPVEINSSQTEHLHRLHTAFGMKQAIELPPNDYDFLVILGGMHTGNHRRIAYAKEVLNKPGINVDRLVMLGGERGVYPESEDKLISENIELIKQSPQTDPLLKKVIEGKTQITNESDMLRLAASIQLGGLVMKASSSHRVLEFEWGGLPVTLTHTKSVPRPLGDPRHTTEGCIADFVTRIKPRQAARVGFIATNPHTERTARSAGRIMESMGRQDIELVPAGPSALDTYSPALYRGEVARNLYEDKLSQ